MKLFKVIYHLKSPVASEWQADTIFGHLCWAKSYLDGESKLLDFLTEYGHDDPPLIVSNGFPGDLLPKPITAPITVAEHGTIKEQIERFKNSKKQKETILLTPKQFEEAIHGKEFVASAQDKHLPWKRVVSKNVISRNTGTTGDEGNLYDFEETVWSRIEDKSVIDIPVSIYVKVRDDFDSKAERLFAFIAEQGYGKRKSVGYGHIGSWSFKPFPGFNSPTVPNGFVTLSNYSPAQGDPQKGYWQAIVKYGKLGESFAAQGNPFKKPLLMFAAGSTFYDSPCKEYYGRIVKNVAHPPYGKVVQYALAFPVAMKISE